MKRTKPIQPAIIGIDYDVTIRTWRARFRAKGIDAKKTCRDLTIAVAWRYAMILVHYPEYLITDRNPALLAYMRAFPDLKAEIEENPVEYLAK